MVVAVVTFEQLAPGLPVETGVCGSLAAWAARELGAAPADAAAIAVLTHLSMVAAGLAVGGASAVLRRGSFRDLLRRRRKTRRGALASSRDAPHGASPRAPT